jgi:type III secretion protein Q
MNSLEPIDLAMPRPPARPHAHRVTAPAFPRVDPGVAQHTNQWLQPRDGLSVSLAGHAFSLEVVAWPGAQAICLSAAFQVGDDPGVLHLPLPWLERTLGAPCTVSLQHARAEQRCLLLEYLFLSALESLETALGERLNFTAEPCPERPLPIRLGLRLSSAASSALLGVELSRGAAACLFEAFNVCTPRSPTLPVAVPFGLAVHRGWQCLSTDELDSLRPGDLVMLDRPAEGVRVQVAGHLQAFATPTPDGLRLDEALFPIPSQRDPLMEQSPATPDQAAGQAPSLDASAAHWPVTLVCEAGRLELSLQALGELVPGSVLALPGSTGGQVTLRANGATFGEGELVWLGESLGVRLTRVATDE